MEPSWVAVQEELKLNCLIMRVYIYMCVYICVCISICIYIYVYICVYIYVYIISIIGFPHYGNLN